jgi:rod shape determining protein RodA
LQNKNLLLKNTDFALILCCGICSAISVVSLYSIYSTMNQISSLRIVIVQRVASLLGLLFAFLISFVDYRELAEYWKWHSAASYFLMALTMLIGYAPPGTTNKAWIRLPLGMSVQTSEILKISTILTLAYFFDKNKKNINEVKTLLKLLALSAVPLLSVAIQKDGGTLLVFIIIVVCMFFSAGISRKVIIFAVSAVVLVSPGIWAFILKDYQKKRILGLFDPESYTSIMWQQIMGRVSIGSGRLLGKGFLSESHNNTPLAYNDFIFSFIAESIGFVGVLLLFALMIFIWMRILSVARRSSDMMGSMICVGIFSMLMAQTFINIGMNLMLLPVIGVTLPLFTAGGTSVLMTYCAIGLVMSVARQNPENLFNVGQ